VVRAIGLDIHRGFCEVAIAEDGQVRPARRIGTAPADLEAFGASLDADDVVTLEATGNAAAIARILAPHVRVVLANPKATKAATRLRAKTDKIDAPDPRPAPRVRVPAGRLAAGRDDGHPSSSSQPPGRISSSSGPRPRTRSTPP